MIGLMKSKMAMGWKHGQEGVAIAANIGRGLGMDLVCIGFIQGMCMLANGQSHGCGVHTCDDGRRYVGEFKWGVKHGLGHYHFR